LYTTAVPRAWQDEVTSETETGDLSARLTRALAESYEVGELIGAGAMGAVFAARDRRHGRTVAIKVIRPVFASSMVSTRFIREIRIAAGLHHPHILPLFDSGEADGLLFYVSPLVVGESLRRRIERERQLPLLDVCHIIRQVGGALTHAHRASIVHRDVKPDNILLSEGNAFVADFGIAKASSEADESSGGTTAGMAVGTPLYMSPEQAAGESTVDARTDQYALACVAYEMLAGQPPFPGTSSRTILAKHISQPPPGIRALRSAASEEAERILKRALAKSPADRFGSAIEFAEALERALAGKPMTVSVSSSGPSLRAHAGRLVSKTCDRLSQVNEFDSFLRRTRAASPGVPQIYLLPGDEGDAHDSLVERLIHTTLSRFAEEIGGFERGSVGRLRTPWPDSDDLESAKRDLTIALLRESDPSYLGDDLSSQSLVNALGKRPQSVIVLHHDLRARHLKRFTPDLVEWYANEYWGALQKARPGQQFVVFLKLIYPPRKQFNIGALLGLAPDGRRMYRDLQERLTRPGLRSACLVFKELQPLTIDDVSEWFSSNGIVESERRRMELAQSIFQGHEQRNMAHVEAALEEIHRKFLNEQHLEFGSIS
jgi:serine/threonine protein kinase